MPTPTPRSGARALLSGAILTIAALLAVPAIPAHAADPDPTTIGVATRPADANGRPDGRTRFSYTADPGQEITDRVFVGNTGTEPQDFTVYGTDGFNDANGQFGLLETGTKPKDVGSWVTFDGGTYRVQFSLAPNEVKLLTFTVHVPANATPGDHVGGVIASVLQKGDQISLDRRVATAIFARVSGELKPRLTITQLSSSHQGDWWNPFDGSVTIRYSVDNPGNVALRANVSAGVATWFGIPVAREKGGGLPVLLPGQSGSYRVKVEGVGRWLFVNPSVTLKPFADTEDKAGQLLPVDPVARNEVIIVPPWTVLLGLAILLAVILLVRSRRRREGERALAWMEETERTAREDAENSRAESPAEKEEAVRGA